MIRRGVSWALATVLLLLSPARAEAPADRMALLRRGVNVTNWFRFPPSADPAKLRGYLSDAALRRLREVGFTAVRLPVQPDVLSTGPARRALLIEAVTRLQQHGFAVMVTAHPAGWSLETSAADRASLHAFWRVLAPALNRLDPRLTFPELLNEPVFPGTPDAWRALQHELLLMVRQDMPRHTIVLSGNDWGSVSGLLALRPEADPNVIYSFHFYDPAELTSLAAYRPELDHAAFAALPFPAADRAACLRAADSVADAGAGALMRYYCGLRWDERRIGDRLQAAAEWGRRNHASVLLGEFGASASLRPDARLNWMAAVRRQAEARDIPWMLWGYDDIMGFAVARPPPTEPCLDTGLLRALGLHGPWPPNHGREMGSAQ